MQEELTWLRISERERERERERENTYYSIDDYDLIHVALAVYDPKGTYSRHAGVVAQSIFEHTSSRVCVHILHDETLTSDNRARFTRTSEMFGQEVRFVDVSDVMKRMSSMFDVDKAGRRFTRGALFRLVMLKLLNIPKVIYLDCDIVINTDVAELWSTDIQNYSLAAVLEPVGSDSRKLSERMRTQVIGYNQMKYFNSGVLLMNLDRIRQQRHNMPEEAIYFFIRYSLFAQAADQDFLNLYFQEDTLFIDERFNLTVSRAACIDNAILHFWRYKPWVQPVHKMADRLYWDTLVRSQWSDQLADVVFDNGYLHYSSSDCMRRILRNVKRELFHKPVSNLRYFAEFLKHIVSEAFHRR